MACGGIAARLMYDRETQHEIYRKLLVLRRLSDVDPKHFHYAKLFGLTALGTPLGFYAEDYFHDSIVSCKNINEMRNRMPSSKLGVLRFRILRVHEQDPADYLLKSPWWMIDGHDKAYVLNIHLTPGVTIKGEDHGEILFLQSARFYFHPDVISAQIPQICASFYKRLNLEAVLPPQLNRDLHTKLVAELRQNEISIYFRSTSSVTNGKTMKVQYRKVDQVSVNYPTVSLSNEGGLLPIGKADLARFSVLGQQNHKNSGGFGPRPTLQVRPPVIMAPYPGAPGIVFGGSPQFVSAAHPHPGVAVEAVATSPVSQMEAEQYGASRESQARSPPPPPPPTRVPEARVTPSAENLASSEVKYASEDIRYRDGYIPPEQSVYLSEADLRKRLDRSRERSASSSRGIRGRGVLRHQGVNRQDSSRQFKERPVNSASQYPSNSNPGSNWREDTTDHWSPGGGCENTDSYSSRKRDRSEDSLNKSPVDPKKRRFCFDDNSEWKEYPARDRYISWDRSLYFDCPLCEKVQSKWDSTLSYHAHLETHLPWMWAPNNNRRGPDRSITQKIKSKIFVDIERFASHNHSVDRQLKVWGGLLMGNLRKFSQLPGMGEHPASRLYELVRDHPLWERIKGTLQFDAGIARAMAKAANTEVVGIRETRKMTSWHCLNHRYCMLILLTFVPPRERVLMLNSYDEQGLGVVDFEKIKVVSCRTQSKNRHVEIIKQRNEKRRLQQIEDAKKPAPVVRGTASPVPSSSENESPRKSPSKEGKKEDGPVFIDAAGKQLDVPMDVDKPAEKTPMNDSLDTEAEDALLEPDDLSIS